MSGNPRSRKTQSSAETPAESPDIPLKQLREGTAESIADFEHNKEAASLLDERSGERLVSRSKNNLDSGIHRLVDRLKYNSVARGILKNKTQKPLIDLLTHIK